MSSCPPMTAQCRAVWAVPAWVSKLTPRCKKNSTVSFWPYSQAHKKPRSICSCVAGGSKLPFSSKKLLTRSKRPTPAAASRSRPAPR